MPVRIARNNRHPSTPDFAGSNTMSGEVMDMQNRIMYAAIVLCLVGCEAPSDYDVSDNHETGGTSSSSHAGGATSTRKSTYRTAQSSLGGANATSLGGASSGGALGSTHLAGSIGLANGTSGVGGSLGVVQWNTGGFGCEATAASPPQATESDATDDALDTDAGIFTGMPQEGSPCMADEHCPEGLVCTTQGVVGELADLGLGRCAEVTTGQIEAPEATTAQ
jgi:hypothetical protein